MKGEEQLPALVMGFVRTEPIDEATARQCIEESCEALAQLLSARELFAWNRRRHRAVPFRRENAAALLGGARLFRGQDPAASHLVSLQRTPGASQPDATLRLAVGGPKDRPAAALQLTVPSHRLDQQDLRDEFERLVEIWSPDRAWLGPRAAAARTLGWLTFVRVKVSGVPGPAEVESVLGGSLLLAHQEAPSSESALALAGYEQVELALARNAASAQPSTGLPRTGARDASAALPKPTYLATPEGSTGPGDPIAAPAAAPDETLPFVLAEPPGSPTPFAGATTPERLAALKAAAPRVPAADVSETNETLAIRSPLIAHARAGKSFTEELTPIAVPALTLDEYARFRALLRLNGEDHEPTWKEFGILSRAAKDSLQARFASHFQRDAQVQAEFVALVERHTRNLGRV